MNQVLAENIVLIGPRKDVVFGILEVFRLMTAKQPTADVHVAV